jgi:hydrogenase maturation factor
VMLRAALQEAAQAAGVEMEISDREILIGAD